MINTARIAKNTIFLYLRMILVLAANFLAVRVLLEVLGVEDYGLFNLIVGFVTLFTFLNGAMLSTVQRFLCFELGRSAPSQQLETRNPQPTTCLIFTLCFWLFAALALLIVLVSETGGLWFVHHKLNIPPARFHSAQIVYQLSIAVMVFKTMQIPYTALIVSYERMNAFAKISIVESVLTLAAAFAIKWTPGDLLVVYAALYTVAQALVFATYALYCRRHFAEGRLVRLDLRTSTPNPQLSTLNLLKSLSGFFSWSILGAIANMLKQQGLNVLLNIFFGVAFNATWAIANKVGVAVSQLVGNFQQAFNPQIIKNWAADDKNPFYKLIFGTSKFSFFLLWIFIFPLMLCIDGVLSAWLGNDVPPQLPLFIRLNMVFFLFEALSGPLWTATQATGRIAAYQVCIAMLIGSTFPLSWMALRIGAPAWSIMAINAVVDCGCHVFRIFYLRKLFGFPSSQYFKCSMLPAVLIVVISCACIFITPDFGLLTHGEALRVGFLSLVNIAVVLLLGLTKAERQFVFEKLSEKLNGGGRA